MTAAQFINILVPITLIEMMVAVGLGVSFAELAAAAGNWPRADADYVLEIKQVAANGQIEAAYLNPKPIHVSKAQATLESGKTTIMVELRDRLYPGSYYTLTYDPREDRLSGVYHHLGVH